MVSRRLRMAPPVMAWVTALAVMVFPLGCASGRRASEHQFEKVPSGDMVEEQLTGEVLAQRKIAMRRAHRDMKQFYKTFQQLGRHQDVESIETFEAFVRPYIRERLDLYVDEVAEIGHPELRPLEVNLLLMKGAVLLQMGKRRQVWAVIDRLKREYGSMGSVLVEYPVGERATLEQSILRLRRERKAL